MKFLIAIEPGDENTAFGVVVPDLPGCFSAGDTLEEAFDNAREAIEAHCQLLAADGGAMPVLRPMAEHQADADLSGWVWAMVEAPVERFFGPAEKINITVPAGVLARIDEYARSHGESRSGFLVRAAQAAMTGA
ncbi:MAG: type II toxin-antitoxin system HicB family antitoxin [Ideonella sp.]|nr:type II toxin-antitoxin system HicB family antitoxin [Ideonella sp.]MCC7455623.1 type II toxin-antitoxin system HicB family antitoxin [Nitrospira sp.]